MLTEKDAGANPGPTNSVAGFAFTVRTNDCTHAGVRSFAGACPCWWHGGAAVSEGRTRCAWHGAEAHAIMHLVVLSATRIASSTIEAFDHQAISIQSYRLSSDDCRGNGSERSLRCGSATSQQSLPSWCMDSQHTPGARRPCSLRTALSAEPSLAL